MGWLVGENSESLFSFAVLSILLLSHTEMCFISPFLLSPSQYRGYNIGVRLVDEFLAKSNVDKCNSFQDTCDVIAKVAFKMFLGINADGTFV